MHTRLTSHHHQHPSTVDPLLRQWRDERGCIRAELRSTPIDDGEKREELQQRVRMLDRKIKQHIRKQVRQAEVEALEKVSSLRPDRMREFWRALKRLGSLNHSVASVPSMVRDASGSLQYGPSAIRKRWFECWSRLAEHKVDDSRFGQQMHEWVLNRMLQEVEPTEEELASIPLNNSLMHGYSTIRSLLLRWRPV